MLELGNIPHVSYAARAANPAHKASSEATKPTPPGKIADDDAAAAVIRNQRYADAGKLQQDNRQTGLESSPDRSVKDIATRLRQRMAKSSQLAGEFANGRYSARKISQDTEIQAAEIRRTAEKSAYPIYSEVSELVVKLRDEIKAVNSFDGFLIGVHDGIEEFAKYTELDIKRIMEFVQNIAHPGPSPQTRESVLARSRKQALAASQCQANLGPERVLHLLKDGTEPDTVEVTAQTASMQESVKE